MDLHIMNENPNKRRNNSAKPQRSTAMFQDIEQLYITEGTFNMNIYNIDPLEHPAFRSLPRSRDAAFNAAINLDNLSRRPCTEGTRVEIIAQIMSWVEAKHPAPPVYWLTGLAGLGKTTIVYTICEQLEQVGYPFVSFFCSLQLDSRNSKRLVTTLCHELAQLYASYAANLIATLRTNLKLVDARLRIQIDELLAKPWRAAIDHHRDPPTPIIIVDALDENDRGTEFLEELLRVIHAGELAGIKFLLTSRPEPKIVDLCKSFPPNVVCRLHEVDTANVQTDIQKYLQEALPELKDDPELASLSQQAGGLFIYATTAVRFICPLYSDRSVSEMRFHLRAMLDATPHDEGDERLLVDELYERILGTAFRDARVRATRLRILHTIVCAESRVNISVLASLTNTDEDTVKRTVESLHAVLYISPKYGCIYWYHASFLDLLFSRARSSISNSFNGSHPTRPFDVFCDAPAHHSVVARRCFVVMEWLHFNMCSHPSSYLFDSDVPGLKASIDETFSLTLRYVLRHWARHLLKAEHVENDDNGLICVLKNFLVNKLLFWIEAMNLLDAKTECASLLNDAELWLGKERSDILERLEDAVNFCSFFAGSPASNSTPHLYISTLSMWNQDSPIWTDWRNRFGFVPSILLPRDGITIPLLTISATGGNICLAFSPNGNQIVTGSLDKSVRIWDVKTATLVMEMLGHTWVVTSVAFSPDGNRIASGSWDKSVLVWDVKTGKLVMEIQGSDKVTSVVFSPDGNRIVFGSWDASLSIWDAKTAKRLRDLQGHTDRVTSVSFSPDGNRIVSSSYDRSVQLWDANTGEQLRVLRGHADWVNSVSFALVENQILSGSSDASIRIWDAKTGEQLKQLRGQSDWVNCVAFSPDGTQIVSGHWDKSVRLWAAETGEQVRELRGHSGWVCEVAFSPDGNRIASCAWDEPVRIWDAKMGQQLTDVSVEGHNDTVSCALFSLDSDRIVSCSYDKSVRLWDAKQGKQLKELQGHTDRITSVACSPDGNRIVSSSLDKSLRIWDTESGEQLRMLRGDTGITSVAFSPDGCRFVSGSWDQSVRVWDTHRGRQLGELQGHTGVVTCVAFSPNGSRIISSSRDNSVRIWHTKTGKQLRELRGHNEGVTSVAFSPVGNRIVSGSQDKLVRLWDGKNGEQLEMLRGHTNSITSVGFSPDGNRIVSGSWDKSVRLWDAKTGEQLRILQGHTSKVASVAFSCDGSRIVSGSGDNSVRVWTNLNTDAPWVVQEDGWIISEERRLAWVPSTIHNALLSLHNVLIVSQNGSARISFEQCKLGPLWYECYTP